MRRRLTYLCLPWVLLGVMFLLQVPCWTQSIRSYTEELEAWHLERINELRKENGWLNLAGLFWLEQGRQSFGSNGHHPIQFPHRSFPGNAGYFERRSDTVILTCESGIPILLNGRPFSSAVVFTGENNDTAIMRYGSFVWTIIKRDDRIGIRLRDLTHPQLVRFTGVDRFPADTGWRVTAKLEPIQGIPAVSITNVLGQTTQQASPGKLIFEVKGIQYSLDALWEGGRLFILFSDATNGESTYASGRFLYAEPPDKKGKTILDFNQSINPPCAFTPFATCPLPPPQNRLPIAVPAGEKDFH